MDYDAEADLKILEAMVSNLKSYLHGSELYGMISQNLPRMTVGGCLLRHYQLNGIRDLLPADQQQQLAVISEQFEALREEWQVHYEEKIVREIKARVRNLNNFVDESEGRSQNSPVEVTRRTIVEHLRQEAERINCWSEELAGEVRQVDQRLRAILGSGKGEFHWAKELKPLYPVDRYWWLYS